MGKEGRGKCSVCQDKKAGSIVLMDRWILNREGGLKPARRTICRLRLEFGNQAASFLHAVPPLCSLLAVLLAPTVTLLVSRVLPRNILKQLHH